MHALEAPLSSQPEFGQACCAQTDKSPCLSTSTSQRQWVKQRRNCSERPYCLDFTPSASRWHCHYAPRQACRQAQTSHSKQHNPARQYCSLTSITSSKSHDEALDGSGQQAHGGGVRREARPVWQPHQSLQRGTHQPPQLIQILQPPVSSCHHSETTVNHRHR